MERNAMTGDDVNNGFEQLEIIFSPGRSAAGIFP